ncbi:MAG: methyl-accepting chemotaxis protein [Microthrixaceae bacterium]
MNLGHPTSRPPLDPPSTTPPPYDPSIRPYPAEPAMRVDVADPAPTRPLEEMSMLASGPPTRSTDDPSGWSIDNTSPIAMVLADETGRIRAMNAAALNLLEALADVGSTDPRFLVGEPISSLSFYRPVTEAHSAIRPVGGHRLKVTQLPQQGGTTVLVEDVTADMAERDDLERRMAELAQLAADAVATAPVAQDAHSHMDEIATTTAAVAEVAAHSLDAVTATKGTTLRIVESTGELTRVVRLLGGIAQQANLLAINATIEASRTGEAAAGFAAVAREVKEMAKATAGAVEELARHSDDVGRDAGDLVEGIGLAEKVFEQVVAMQSDLAALAASQRETTDDLVREVRGTADALSRIAEGVSPVTDLTVGADLASPVSTRH